MDGSIHKDITGISGLEDITGYIRKRRYYRIYQEKKILPGLTGQEDSTENFLTRRYYRDLENSGFTRSIIMN